MPEKLWPFALKHVTFIRQILPSPRLGDRTPHEVLRHDTPDISQLLDFDLYQFVKYRALDASFPEPTMQLGRWLGIAHDIGQSMCYWILKSNGQIVARSTVRPLY